MAKATAPPARKSRPLLSMLETKRFCLFFFIGIASVQRLSPEHSADGVIIETLPESCAEPRRTATRRSRRLENHRWAEAIPGAVRVRRDVSGAEVACNQELHRPGWPVLTPYVLVAPKWVEDFVPSRLEIEYGHVQHEPWVVSPTRLKPAFLVGTARCAVRTPPRGVPPGTRGRNSRGGSGTRPKEEDDRLD